MRRLPAGTITAACRRRSARLLAVRNGMDVFAPEILVCAFTPSMQRLLGRLCWNQGIAAGADQILATGLLQRLAHLKIVFRLEELHQRALQLTVMQIRSEERRVGKECRSRWTPE